MESLKHGINKVTFIAGRNFSQTTGQLSSRFRIATRDEGGLAAPNPALREKAGLPRRNAMNAGSALPKTLLRNTMPAMPSLTLKAVALRSLCLLASGVVRG